MFVVPDARPRFLANIVLPSWFRCRPLARREPSFGCSSANRKDVSCEVNFIPTLAASKRTVVVDPPCARCALDHVNLFSATFGATCVFTLFTRHCWHGQ